MTLDYAGRCQRYARQRGWTYDPKRMSIQHLTPRQRRRAIHKERAQAPGYSHREIDMPWDPRYGPYNDGDDGAFCEPLPTVYYDYYFEYAADAHDLGYCVTPGCNCCGGDD